MKKKNLAVLCLLPFLIALLGLSTATVFFSTLAKDITGIRFDYRENEGLKVGLTLSLKAEPIYDSHYVLDKGNDLTWKESKADTSDEDHVEITREGDNYILKALSVGKSTITCSNEKGNVSKSFTLYTYQNGVLLLNSSLPDSGSRIDPKRYLGEYDLVDGKKEKAEIKYTLSVQPEQLKNSLTVSSITSNISYDLTTNTLRVLSSGDASFTLSVNTGGIDDVTTSYTIIKDGINAKTYSDLLFATKENPSPIVLQNSFGRLNDVYYLDDKGKVQRGEDGKPLVKDSSMALFGNYNFDTESFSFKNEVYSHTTTFNKACLDQWNEFASKDSSYQSMSEDVYSALHITKDFYGNGFSMNFHDLCYPKKKTTQNGHERPILSSDDLFRGPLPFYFLGSPQNPLIEVYGEDNAGLFIDGDNIVLDDVKVRNCDFGDSLSNLDTVGSVVDIKGNNNTIRNCVLENGKHVVRAYSATNLTIDNSMLSNARNFLLEIGTDEYVTPDSNESKSFLGLDGKEGSKTIGEFFADTSSSEEPVPLSADNILGSYLQVTSLTDDEKSVLLSSLNRLDQNLNDKTKVDGTYKTSVSVKDTYFYRSGISAIVFDSLFQGPFLYSRSPSLFTNLLLSLQDQGSSKAFPLLASGVGGISYPSSLKLQGKTRFYDYKNAEDMDISGLIGQRLSDLVDSTSGTTHNITIDKIFPIKNLLFPQIQSKGYDIAETDETGVNKDYLNIPISYYGGGVNQSSLDISELDNKDELSESLNVDLLSSSLPVTASTSYDLHAIALRAIELVTGFAPFRFYSYNAKKDKALYNEYPTYESLIENAKGGQNP